MADPDADTAEPTDKGGKSFKLLQGKSDKQRQQILVGVGIAGVVLTFILIKRSSANSAAAASSAAPATGAVPTAGSAPDPGMDPNTGQSYASELASLQASLGGSSSPTSISNTPAPSPGYASGGAPGQAGPSGSQLLGFSSPNVPVSMANGMLTDTNTGRQAYYGPGGQPAYGSPTPGTKSWIQPGGKTAWYKPAGAA